MGSFNTPLPPPTNHLLLCLECIPISLVLHVLEWRWANMAFQANQGLTSQYIQSLQRQHSPVLLLIQDSTLILRRIARLTIDVEIQRSQFRPCSARMGLSTTSSTSSATGGSTSTAQWHRTCTTSMTHSTKPLLLTPNRKDKILYKINHGYSIEGPQINFDLHTKIHTNMYGFTNLVFGEEKYCE